MKVGFLLFNLRYLYNNGLLRRKMSNYTLNNIRRIITHIEEDDYWDMHLNEAYTCGMILNENCLISSIDTTNPESMGCDELISLIDYFYEDGCYNGIRLENIGYTGVDNGLISYRKDRIDYDQFYDLYTNSVYEIKSGDTRLHLHKVVGNSLLYEYPTSINEDGSIKLNGGFYQGFFRGDNNYAVLPSELKADQEWNLVFDVKKVNYEPESDKTLNDYHPQNKGIFFYIGTRAENKWIYLYKQLPMSGNAFENCELIDDFDYTFDLIEEETRPSDNTYETTTGFSLDSPNDAYIISDNKFLIFDRTKDGITIHNYVGDETVMLDYKKRNFDGNLFLYMNHTPTGYTTHNIDEVIFSSAYTSYDMNTFYSDIYNNALAFIINDNGSIGYRYLVKDCLSNSEDHIKILEGNSYEGIIKDEIWTNIRVRIKGYVDGMKLMFYVNGKLKYITMKLPKLNLKMLDELSEKQEGVAYNISLGGGTQGLAETIMPDYMLVPTQSFPLEDNFAGTFIGDIKGFKFYNC